MRKIRLALAGLLSLGFVFASGTVADAAIVPSLAACKSALAGQEYLKGKLTVATDRPVNSPWFVNSKPANAQGYESALVYALASVLGVKKSDVTWVSEPFDASYAPGRKAFDFDVNEVTYTYDRAQAVTFSDSYYDVQQSIVALKKDAIVKKHSPAQLKTYQYGDPIGTTGLAYINNYIKPTKPVRVYATLDQTVAALQSGRIDALVIDTPTGQYMTSTQIVDKSNNPLTRQVGQFPNVGEHYGLVFEKNNPLATCVNIVLATLRSRGTLAALTKKWLDRYTRVPTIQP